MARLFTHHHLRTEIVTFRLLGNPSPSNPTPLECTCRAPALIGRASCDQTFWPPTELFMSLTAFFSIRKSTPLLRYLREYYVSVLCPSLLILIYSFSYQSATSVAASMSILTGPVGVTPTTSAGRWKVYRFRWASEFGILLLRPMRIYSTFIQTLLVLLIFSLICALFISYLTCILPVR